MAITTVVFACAHNAGRSQMACAFFNALADPAKARAVSAGTQPGDRVHPEVVATMREAGIELSHVRPQLLTDELAGIAQLLVTMGCGEACPFLPGLERKDWPLPDPKGQPLEQVRRIRDDVRRRVEDLVAVRGWANHPRGNELRTYPRPEVPMELGKIYVCTKCGAQVIVTKGGSGTVKCCDVPMELKRPEEKRGPTGR